MPASNIKLYGFVTSPYVQKVACYLTYKELDYDIIYVDPIKPKRQIGFTKQRQVPVLTIDDEWRRDSTALGIWLDELFPEKPILGTSKSERETILSIDQWVSNTYIPSMLFRLAVDIKALPLRIPLGWRLAHILNKTKPLGLGYRLMWPLAISFAPFIHDIVKDVDMNESLKAMQKRIYGELKHHLGNGPFLGGMQQPSLADLSLYPLIITNYQTMLPFKSSVAQAALPKEPEIQAWLKRVSTSMPKSPLIADPSCITQALPWD